MTEQERLARAAIEKTMAICTQAGDARKAQAYANCFTLDGVLELEHKTYSGREAVLGFMQAPSVIRQPDGPSPGFVSHHLTTCRIELNSDTQATVRTYWLVTSAAGLDHNGYYDDRFRREDGDWLISYRRPRTLWVSPNSLIASQKIQDPSE